MGCRKSEVAAHAKVLASSDAEIHSQLCRPGKDFENDERASDDPSTDNFYSTPTFKMGRLHSKGKGIASSAIPYSRAPPAWLKTTPEQVVDQICKLARKGATPSQIGVVLRDSHGVAQVKVVTGTSHPSHLRVKRNQKLTYHTGNKILRILKSSGTVHPV